jgi:hypothetical protein
MTVWRVFPPSNNACLPKAHGQAILSLSVLVTVEAVLQGSDALQRSHQEVGRSPGLPVSYAAVILFYSGKTPAVNGALPQFLGKTVGIEAMPWCNFRPGNIFYRCKQAVVCAPKHTNHHLSWYPIVTWTNTQNIGARRLSHMARPDTWCLLSPIPCIGAKLCSVEAHRRWGSPTGSGRPRRAGSFCLMPCIACTPHRPSLT